MRLLRDVAWNASSAPRFAEESPADRQDHPSVVRDACLERWLCRLAIDIGGREPIDQFRTAQLTNRPDVAQPLKLLAGPDPSSAHRCSPEARGTLSSPTYVLPAGRGCLTPLREFFVKPALRSTAKAAITSAGDLAIQPADFADAEQTLAMPVGPIDLPFMVAPPDLTQSASVETTFIPRTGFV